LKPKGISDLKNGIIKTPLDSNTTFYDDPLRILRVARFASTYNFLVSEFFI
jgi:tRNA nucleotidyltransferase/poly(A) polymerase